MHKKNKIENCLRSRRTRSSFSDNKNTRLVMFYDFSSFSDVDFQTSLQEHLADYERSCNCKDSSNNTFECQPPVIQHFVKTYITDYFFIRYLIFLNSQKENKQDLEVYLIMRSEFSEEDKEFLLNYIHNHYIPSNLFDLPSEDRSMNICSESFIDIKGILNFSTRDTLIEEIETILDPQSKDIDVDIESTSRYVLISNNDYSDVFEEHSIIPENETPIVNQNYLRARYEIFNYNGEYSSSCIHAYVSYKFNNDRIIFLDIDGVLNRDDHYYDEERHEFYNENMVKELSYIIKKTGAKIILTSSWRGAISNYINGNKSSYDHILKEFLKLLYKEQVFIYGFTPYYEPSGLITRPYEVISWLRENPTIRSFVILEDDEWRWGCLRNNVVNTVTPLSEQEQEAIKLEYERNGEFIYSPVTTKDGLTRELAEKAIEILLHENDACIF